MRVLHVGWGFTPWREGGLIAYAEDLMAAQVGRGWDVSYFLSGRHYPYISGPRLKRWRRGGVTMHEVVNPPIVAALELGTRHPERDLSEPRFEAAFARVIEGVRPQLVHFQELHGLPSSLIDVAARADVPTVMTLHDYGPLCATLRLFDADGRICRRRDVGADCVARNANAPTGPGPNVAITLNFELARARRLLRLGAATHLSVLRPVVEGLRRHAVRSTGEEDADEVLAASSRPGGRAALEGAFQRRREINVERLGRVGRLIAQSPRVAEIYRELGVSGERMSVMPAPAEHIGQLRPRRYETPPFPVTFATLNGCASPSKGSATVAAALRALRAAGLEGSFQLRIHGRVDPAVQAELSAYAGVELCGLYRREELNSLLQDVDVGIMPSMWEEAYGYTGLEMIAKGVPLIANPLGGIVEYAQEGRTAWLNRSCSGEGLAELMSQVIRNPQVVVEMHDRVVAAREHLITPWGDHVGALEQVYREVIA